MALKDTPDVEDFYDYLRRLFGSTYGPEDRVVTAGTDPIWQQQLRSWAVLLQLGRDSIDRAFRQTFPALSDELISEWEQVFRLPNDTARTIAERQARLAAIERTHRGGDLANLRDALRTESAPVTISGNLRDDTIFSGAEDDAIFQATIQLTVDEYTNPTIRQAVERIFWSMAPARNLGDKGLMAEAEKATRFVGTRHADPNHYLDIDSLIRQTSVARKSPLQVSRMVSYGPGSKLRAHDLNRIQEGMMPSILFGDGTKVVDTSGVDAGGVRLWFSYTTATGVEDVIDDSIDWRNRFVVLYIAEVSGTDIRPGQAADDEQGLVHDVNPLALYTGPGNTSGGGTGEYRARSLPSNGSWIYARDTDGALIARSISGTYYGHGYLVATDPFEPAPVGLGFDSGFDSGFA